jgi:hypothetical protein
MGTIAAAFLHSDGSSDRGAGDRLCQKWNT